MPGTERVDDRPAGRRRLRRARLGVRRGRRPRREERPPETGVLLVCAIVAGTQMTWGLVIPVLPVYVVTLGASPAMLGVVVAAFGLGRLVVNVPAGAATQRFSHRGLLVGSVAAIALATIATALVTTIAELVAVRALTGLAGGVAITTGQAMLSNSEPERLGRTMGNLQAFQLAGAAVGPALGGALVALGPQVPFLAGGLVLVVLVVLAAACPLPRWQRPSVAQKVPVDRPTPRLWTAGLVSISLVGFTVFFVRFGGQQFLFPVLAYERAGLSPAELGFAIAATTLLSLGLVRPAGSLTDRWGRRPMVIASTTAVGLAVLGFLAAGTTAVFVGALVVTGVAMAFTGPASGAYLVEAVDPQRRGTAIGVYRTCGDVAILLGPLALGWLVAAQAEALAVVLLASTTILVAGTFALLSRPRRTRPRPLGDAVSDQHPATPPAADLVPSHKFARP